MIKGYVSIIPSLLSQNMDSRNACPRMIFFLSLMHSKLQKSASSITRRQVKNKTTCKKGGLTSSGVELLACDIVTSITS